MKSPAECENLEDVRAGIDRLDAQIIAAMGERLRYVKAASAFKKDEKSIPAPERVAAMLPPRRAWAREAGLDEDFVEKMFRELIAWFINEQITYYRATAGIRLAGQQAVDRAKLLDMLHSGHDRACSSGRAVLVSLTWPIQALDPIEAFEAARKCSESTFLWSRSDDDIAILGIDAAREFTACDGDRFVEITRLWRELLENAVIDNPQGRAGSGPVLSGGFSFDPEQVKTALWSEFPDASMVLPRLQVTNSAGGTCLTLNATIGPADDPVAEADRLEQLWRHLLTHYATIPQTPGQPEPDDGECHSRDVLRPAQWQALVRDAADEVRAGSLYKVVLAREVHLTQTRPFDIPRALDQLRRIYPGAFLFAVARGRQCFFGATPERLVRLLGRKVDVTALAGTCQRGGHGAEDRALGEQLMKSAKDRHEHALVVGTLRAALQSCCEVLNVPHEPVLLKLKNMQHLHTPVSGELKAGVTLLDLVATLHPTPAVGGLPRAPALQYLRTHEQLDRGWYAAPVGWMDAHGDGEFAVALRSALVNGSAASLFAGCGIVGDSEPEHEFLETCLKLRTMMFALGQDERAHG